jgi:hypothetical protein
MLTSEFKTIADHGNSKARALFYRDRVKIWFQNFGIYIFLDPEKLIPYFVFKQIQKFE